MLELWKTTDELVLKMIAHAKGDLQDMFQLDGKTAKRLRSEWCALKAEEHNCLKNDYEKEDAKLLEIIERNLDKIAPRTHHQEGQSSHEEERKDEAYIK